MFVRLLLLLVCFASLGGAAIALYLTDGAEMSVREYEVIEDRVRYYSLERSQWEEIPFGAGRHREDRVTHRPRRNRREAIRRETNIEKAAERRGRTELHNVPIEEGIYHYADNTATFIDQSEIVLEVSKKRTFLKIMAPMPNIPSKRVLTVEGAQSKFVVREDRPIIFVRMGDTHRLELAKLASEPGKKRRVVQIINYMHVSDEMVEEQEVLRVFRQQLAKEVYRIWPVDPLPAGEYAIIDFTAGEANLRVWDFPSNPQPRRLHDEARFGGRRSSPCACRRRSAAA